MKNIFIIGGGCWGSTLATIFAKKGLKITLYEPLDENYNYLKDHRHPKFFSYVKIPDNVNISNNITLIQNSNIVFLVLPSIYVAEVIQKIKNLNIKNKIFISCVKGFDPKTFKPISKIIRENLNVKNENIFVLSGPSHAEEVAMGKPTAVCLAGKNKNLLVNLQKLLVTETLRIYTNTDLIGIEIAGAVKNIYAIAAGICDGLKLGNNAKAALLTRALKEMVLIGFHFGAKIQTFFGLSGIGDLLTTAYSSYSRNRTFGEYLVIYEDIEKAKQNVRTFIEGIHTVKTIHKIAKKYSLELPIAEEVYKIVYKNKPPELSIKSLLTRPLKEEFGWLKEK
jgi:glycerol-3-phosphate dehydrogenase (NAD(P)+)